MVLYEWLRSSPFRAAGFPPVPRNPRGSCPFRTGRKVKCPSWNPCGPSRGGCGTIIRVPALPISGSTERKLLHAVSPALCTRISRVVRDPRRTFGDRRSPRPSGGPLAVNGRSGGARTRTSIAHRRTTGDHEELRVSRSGFPTIRSPVDGSRCIRVTAYRKLGHQTGRCRMTGKAVRLLYLGPFPSAHLLALPFFALYVPLAPESTSLLLRLGMSFRFASRSVKSKRRLGSAMHVVPRDLMRQPLTAGQPETEDGGLAAAAGVEGPPNPQARTRPA